MIENSGAARAVMEFFDNCTHNFGRKHLHRHRVVGVEYASILNPEWELRLAVLRNRLTEKHSARHASPVAAGWHQISDRSRAALAGEKTVRGGLIDCGLE